MFAHFRLSNSYQNILKIPSLGRFLTEEIQHPLDSFILINGPGFQTEIGPTQSENEILFSKIYTTSSNGEPDLNAHSGRVAQGEKKRGGGFEEE